MSPEQEYSRGLVAERVLTEPLLKEAFAAIEQAITDEWRSSKDAARRDRLWVELHALTRVKSHLQDALNSGKIAGKQLGRVKNWLL